LILFTASFFVQKIHLKDAEKQNNIHQNDDRQGDAAHCVGEKRNLVSVQHQPSGHPAQSQNTEYQKRANIEEAVKPVDGMLAGNSLNNHKLPEVKKNGIDFNQKSHNGVANITVSQLRQPKTSDDLQMHQKKTNYIIFDNKEKKNSNRNRKHEIQYEKVMDHKFERALFSVVQRHIDEIMDEIT